MKHRHDKKTRKPLYEMERKILAPETADKLFYKMRESIRDVSVMCSAVEDALELRMKRNDTDYEEAVKIVYELNSRLGKISGIEPLLKAMCKVSNDRLVSAMDYKGYIIECYFYTEDNKPVYRARVKKDGKHIPVLDMEAPSKAEMSWKLYDGIDALIDETSKAS